MATAKKNASPVTRVPTTAKRRSKVEAGPVSSKRASDKVKGGPAKPAFKKISATNALKPKGALGQGPASKGRSPNPPPDAAPVNTTNTSRIKKLKLVRDSFTIPKPEYLVIDQLKLRANKMTRPAKKSELIRAGIKVLAGLSDAAFLTALKQVPQIKTGRPALRKQAA